MQWSVAKIPLDSWKHDTLVGKENKIINLYSFRIKLRVMWSSWFLGKLLEAEFHNKEINESWYKHLAAFITGFFLKIKSSLLKKMWSSENDKCWDFRSIYINRLKSKENNAFRLNKFNPLIGYWNQYFVLHQHRMYALDIINILFVFQRC